MIFFFSLLILFNRTSQEIVIRFHLFMQIKNPAQLDVALLFVGAIGPESFSLDEFEQACGVGMVLVILPILMIIMNVTEGHGLLLAREIIRLFTKSKKKLR